MVQLVFIISIQFTFRNMSEPLIATPEIKREDAADGDPKDGEHEDKMTDKASQEQLE